MSHDEGKQCPSCYAVRATWITGCTNPIHPQEPSMSQDPIRQACEEWLACNVPIIYVGNNKPAWDADVDSLLAFAKAQRAAEALAEAAHFQALGNGPDDEQRSPEYWSAIGYAKHYCEQRAKEYEP